jgi:hypothetical protein
VWGCIFQRVEEGGAYYLQRRHHGPRCVTAGHLDEAARRPPSRSFQNHFWIWPRPKSARKALRPRKTTPFSAFFGFHPLNTRGCGVRRGSAQLASSFFMGIRFHPYPEKRRVPRHKVVRKPQGAPKAYFGVYFHRDTREMRAAQRRRAPQRGGQHSAAGTPQRRGQSTAPTKAKKRTTRVVRLKCQRSIR